MSSYVCQDLIDYILQRLPVKSVSWCSRIATSEFIRKHTLQSMKAPLKILIRHVKISKYEDGSMEDMYTLHSKDQLPLCSSGGYITAVKFPYITEDKFRIPSPSPSTKIIGSCNGVICLFARLKDKRYISLWSFSVRRELSIPDHHYLRASIIKGYYNNIGLGFGFDSTTNDLKILVMLPFSISKYAILYSMKTNSWREITSPTITFHIVKSKACFFKGTLHWVVCSTESLTNDDSLIIVKFNLSSHVFGTISLPEPSYGNIEVTIIGGSIAVIARDGDSILIYQMREYGNVASWTLFHKMDINEFGGARIWKPINNADLLFCAFVGPFDVYNPEIGVISRLLKLRDSCREIDMVTYVESLELLDRGTPCGETIFSLTKKRYIKKSGCK